jgi:exopolyphosphatase/guanosine-5'-triphosphate,3'-diphosphate pyrophosphatase
MSSSVSGVVPRWEWRTFGETLEPAESTLAEREIDRVQDSDEVYLLSRESDASVKVRDDLMDVKLLEAVDDEGLEQWRPVLKASFPLAAADVRTVLDALAVPAPELARESYTLDELVEEVIGANAALSAVGVGKHRTHRILDGCMVELSDVTAEGRSMRTIAVEAEDAGLVAATVRELGLAGHPNVCLARGLKTMLGY